MSVKAFLFIFFIKRKNIIIYNSPFATSLKTNNFNQLKLCCVSGVFLTFIRLGYTTCHTRIGSRQLRRSASRVRSRACSAACTSAAAASTRSARSHPGSGTPAAR